MNATQKIAAIMAMTDDKGALPVVPDALRVAGYAVDSMLRRRHIWRASVEAEHGLLGSTMTLICAGHTTGVAGATSWHRVLETLGAKDVARVFPVETWERDRVRLLESLFVLEGFKDGVQAFEKALERAGTEWRHLNLEMKAWREGIFNPRSVRLLQEVLGVDPFKEDNSDGFMLVMEDWQALTGLPDPDNHALTWATLDD